MPVGVTSFTVFTVSQTGTPGRANASMVPLTPVGDRTAQALAGTRAGPYLMCTLAAPTVALMLFVLFTGAI